MSNQDDLKARVKNAISGYLNRQDVQQAGPTRKNEKPEKEVEQKALAWLRSNGFHMSVVESKATYDPKRGRYISQSVKDGFVDLVGNHFSGLSVFIELKAPGRRATLRDNQRAFLMAKIETGCFAVCIDDVELLAVQFEEFQKMRKRQQFQLSKDFLRAALPVRKASLIDDEPLFPEEP